MEEVQSFIEQVIQNVERVIVGKREAIELVMVALLCEGHVLLEDVPGSGKTMLARSIAISLGIDFKRIQCTPDLLPNDVTGVSIFNQQSSEFEFRPGPVFVNILLADEINRATPRTQSALLEAMQEQQVTVDGVTRPLPRPFIVLATQNPIEYEGTFPLPEAQLDRFLLRLALGYPQREDERTILRNLKREHPITKLSQVVDGLRLLELQKKIWEVNVDHTIESYIVDVVNSSRENPDLALGVSPRGSLALYKSAQAYASIQGRDYVIPDDVRYLLPYVITHRLIIRPDAGLRGRTTKNVVEEIKRQVPLDLGDIKT
ncbi:MAG: AAA domain-containing protein [Aliifodinibius sp.]|nr:MoxR family ATPase [candidate division Zixibacteria bacterium]NIT60842.1 MoxR family ATPase [Fodinibius sp.]NIW48878.1 AAA domain-containing protein [Gammaproteobacteria bacterium]NIR66927.1 MoxR family ATPase [candidate division Zixibacteria bacterium]NIS48384.1 MoxR family ATPase [candidate division Zixibacteria bacterium]